VDRPKFLVDRMLGRLVAWLRIFDYDTQSALELHIEENEDRRLVELALQESRVLLSRDRELIDRAKKAGAEAILISPDKVTDQLCELLRHITITTVPIMERCTVCNGRLRLATPEDLSHTADYVPEHLIAEGKEFWVCQSCGKIYWMGSHWRNILRTTSEIDRCKK
jgi:uncharacterized protein with PIN domain